MSPVQLENWVLRALDMNSETLVLPRSRGAKPIQVAVADSGGVNRFRIYAWRITHGGATRAASEYRIQITGAYPTSFPGEQTLILGWSEEFEVFAAWDPVAHLNRTAVSPSLQVSQQTLEAAYDRGVAAETRGSGDVVVAFKAELLTGYSRVAGDMHAEDSNLLTRGLNEIPGSVPSAPRTRTRVTQVIESYYRSWDFGGRVLGAYDYSCAICGIQLGLVEAAHILPVAVPTSTDETRNGLALCRIHHRAYDALLIDISPELTLKVSRTQLARLGSLGRAEGSSQLLELEGQYLSVLPFDASDRPHPLYLEQGSRARHWQP